MHGQLRVALVPPTHNISRRPHKPRLRFPPWASQAVSISQRTDQIATRALMKRIRGCIRRECQTARTTARSRPQPGTDSFFVAAILGTWGTAARPPIRAEPGQCVPVVHPPTLSTMAWIRHGTRVARGRDRLSMATIR